MNPLEEFIKFFLRKFNQSGQGDEFTLTQHFQGGLVATLKGTDEHTELTLCLAMGTKVEFELNCVSLQGLGEYQVHYLLNGRLWTEFCQSAQTKWQDTFSTIVALNR